MPIEVKEGQCESCGIFTDGVEEYYIFEYRERKVCSWCQALWRRKEERAEREISWEEFVSGEINEENTTPESQ